MLRSLRALKIPHRAAPRRAPRRAQSTSNETRFPYVWRGAAVYAGVGLAASSYQLMSLDAEDAAQRAATDAWGARRQLEGLEELLDWLEWSASGPAWERNLEVYFLCAQRGARVLLNISSNLWRISRLT